MSCLRNSIPGLRAASQHVSCTPVAVPIGRTVNPDAPPAKPKLRFAAVQYGVSASTSLFGHTSVRGVYTGNVGVVYPKPGKLSEYVAMPHNDLPAVDHGDVRKPGWKLQTCKDERQVNQQLPGYILTGVAGGLAIYMAKYVAIGFVKYIGPARDLMAAAAIEIDLSQIPEGKNVTIEWRGKPLFIRHRTAAEIADADAVDIGVLRDPETDKARFPRQKFLVVLGICTHLGCVPISHMGDFGGYYCPCHGSHYDVSGRIHKGPAPLNLEIPPFEYIDDTTIIVGKVD